VKKYKLSVYEVVAVIILSVTLIFSFVACGGENEGSNDGSSDIDASKTQTEGDAVADTDSEKVISFGSWRGVPLNWRVLTVDGEKTLLITEDIIAVRPYNEEETDVYWEDCDLRQWLNDDFLTTALSTDEQDAVLITDVNNETYSVDMKIPSGNNTTDKVFLLSVDEYREYFVKNSPFAYYTFTEDDKDYYLDQYPPTPNDTDEFGAFLDAQIARSKIYFSWWFRTNGYNEGSHAMCGPGLDYSDETNDVLESFEDYEDFSSVFDVQGVWVDCAFSYGFGFGDDEHVDSVDYFITGVGVRPVVWVNTAYIE
jgi:hypothetical protein